MNNPDIQAKVAATRADLERTLDAIEDRFNVSKQASDAMRRAQASYEKNPVPWVVGATATALVVVGLVAWALLSDDD